MEEYADLNPRVKYFVERYINSFIAWDLALFFRDNPYAVGSAESLAQGIGRRGSDLQLPLEKLAELGILAKENSSCDPAGPVYSYQPPAEYREDLEEFRGALRDRAARLIIVSWVLRQEAGRSA